MSKKQFIGLADTIRATMPSEKNAPALYAHWVITRDALANFCAEQNPAFNRALWLDYIAGKCGANGGAVK